MIFLLFMAFANAEDVGGQVQEKSSPVENVDKYKVGACFGLGPCFLYGITFETTREMNNFGAQFVLNNIGQGAGVSYSFFKEERTFDLYGAVDYYSSFGWQEDLFLLSGSLGCNARFGDTPIYADLQIGTFVEMYESVSLPTFQLSLLYGF